MNSEGKKEDRAMFYHSSGELNDFTELGEVLGN